MRSEPGGCGVPEAWPVMRWTYELLESYDEGALSESILEESTLSESPLEESALLESVLAESARKAQWVSACKKVFW